VTEIVFLGTSGAFTTDRRTNLAFIIERPGFRILVEVGPPIMYQLSRSGYKATDIEHVFVSHLHGDHTLGFPMLALNRIDTVNPLRIYGGRTTLRHLRELWKVAYPDLDALLVNSEWCERAEDRAERSEIAPGVILETRRLPHPPGAVTLGARWEFDGGPAIAFVTDTIPNPTTVELARGCDLLIHEATFSAVLQPRHDPSTYFHSTARQAGEIGRQAGIRCLALVHLGPDASNRPDVLSAEARADSNLKVIIPEDGERLCLGEN
jgi:ribonuclease Z